MKHQITEKVGYWIDDAITKHGQGENILWESGLLPGPEGQALYTIFVWFPGAVLGTVMNGSFQLHDALGATNEDVDKIIGAMLEQFRTARSQQLAANGQQQVNGQQTPSGLLIP